MDAPQIAPRWFRSAPALLDFATAAIDSDAGILRDVVMVEEGEAKGHGIHLESEFINDLIAYDRRHFSTRGVKARLGHPGASENTMGSQLGYFRNVRKREKGGKMQAIADLHLLDSADLSPSKPNMREWVLSMAQEAPDFIMSSIVFRPGRYYQRKGNGTKRYVWEYKETKDEDGNKSYVWVSQDPALGKVYVEFGDKGAHHFTDLVEQGAATESLFSNQANDHLYIAQAERFLEEHPQLLEFIQQHPDKVHGFLAQLGLPAATEPAKPIKFSMSKILDFLFNRPAADADDPTAPDTVDATELAALRTEFDAARTQVQALQTERDTLQTQLNEANTALTAERETSDGLRSQVTALQLQVQQADARIAELEKDPATEHTGGSGAELGAATSNTPLWDKFKTQFGL
jgi:hypothetical protein